jgi:hypothetical protein
VCDECETGGETVLWRDASNSDVQWVVGKENLGTSRELFEISAIFCETLPLATEIRAE